MLQQNLSGVLFKDECKAVVEDGNAVETWKIYSKYCRIDRRADVIIMCFTERIQTIR